MSDAVETAIPSPRFCYVQLRGSKPMLAMEVHYPGGEGRWVTDGGFVIDFRERQRVTLYYHLRDFTNGDPIEDALAAHYGDKCQDFDPDCDCCKAYAELERLRLLESKDDLDAAKSAKAESVAAPYAEIRNELGLK